MHIIKQSAQIIIAKFNAIDLFKLPSNLLKKTFTPFKQIAKIVGVNSFSLFSFLFSFEVFRKILRTIFS